MIKTFIPAFVLASALAAPAFAFAQSTQPLTRAEVRADLVRLEKAGYVPGADEVNYPADIQAAEQRVAEEDAANASYGPSTSGTSASGHASPEQPTNAGSVYSGH
jgi:Domain of unknown function (DUF4148)